ncbi:MAG: cytidylate kinase-like family protein [Gemmatimonadales bacterium]
MLITISRQYGAGGSAVAALVAERLGWTVVDNELVDRVAVRAGLSRQEVADRQERSPGFVERIGLALAASSAEILTPEAAAAVKPADEPRLVEITERVVREIAAKGQVVLVGRAAVAVLARNPEALHVLLVAPKPERIREAAERLGVDAKEAERVVDTTDASRTRFHREHYDRDWTDPAGYHLVLNTSALGYSGAADVIVARARALGWG